MSTPTIVSTAAPTTSAAPAAPAVTAAPVTPAAQGSGATYTDWTTGFNDEAKGYVQNKGWKAPTDLLDSYRNFEKLQGVPQDQILRLPKDDDAAGVSAMYDRLGRPSNPDGYKLGEIAQGGDVEFMKAQAAAFHKAGLSKKQAESLAKDWIETQTTQQNTQKEAFQTKVTQEVSNLKKEWGAAYDQNCKMGKRAAAELGVDGPTISKLEGVIGTAATLKLFQQIGSKFGEGSFVAGNPGGGGNGPLTPEQAKARITANRGDHDFTKKYIAGNSKERMEMEMLHKYAYPEVS